MQKVRTAVIGVGYLGRFHAQKYAALPGSQLIGIADVSSETRAKLGAELGTATFADYRELLERVDAVSIATPTPQHFEIASAFLEAGAHVLVEKPITATVEEPARWPRLRRFTTVTAMVCASQRIVSAS